MVSSQAVIDHESCEYWENRRMVREWCSATGRLEDRDHSAAGRKQHRSDTMARKGVQIVEGQMGKCDKNCRRRVGEVNEIMELHRGGLQLVRG